MRTPVMVVGAAVMLLVMSQWTGAQSQKSASPMPVSATVDCTGESGGADTLIELGPTQRFALTDYLVRNRATEDLGAAFGSYPVRKFSITVPSSGFVHHSFVTAIVFQGADGHVQVGCNLPGAEVSVSGTLQ
jgi:hypothetical protein